MSELAASPEFEPVAETIASVIQEWLVAEKETSLTGNNAILNEYDRYGAAQGLAFDDPKNAFTAKGRGHFDRLKQRTSGLIDEETATDDFYALQLFDALVTLSGHYRLQCVAAANSEEHYMGLRYRPASLGVDLSTIVSNRLIELFGRLPTGVDLSNPTMTFDELMAKTQTVNEHRLEMHKKLFDGRKISGMRKVITAARLGESQVEWLELATDYIVFSAYKHNGQLSAAPFMEPKSISYAQLDYPLQRTPPYYQVTNHNNS